MQIYSKLLSYYGGTRATNLVKREDLDQLSADLAAKCVPLDISTPKNIYFEKSVKFPRTKLALVDNVKRVIKIDKADVIIVDPKINFKSFWSACNSYIEEETGELILSPSNRDLGSNYTLVEKGITACILPPATNIPELENILHNCTQDLVDIAVFNTSITVNTPNKLDVKALKSLLNSTNDDYILLGLKTMCQFNIMDHRLIFIELLKSNGYTLSGHKFWQSALGINLLATLKIEKNWLYYDDLPILYNKVYPHYTEEERIQLLKVINETRYQLILSAIENINEKYRNAPDLHVKTKIYTPKVEIPTPPVEDVETDENTLSDDTTQDPDINF